MIVTSGTLAGETVAFESSSTKLSSASLPTCDRLSCSEAGLGLDGFEIETPRNQPFSFAREEPILKRFEPCCCLHFPRRRSIEARDVVSLGCEAGPMKPRRQSFSMLVSE